MEEGKGRKRKRKSRSVEAGDGANRTKKKEKKHRDKKQKKREKRHAKWKKSLYKAVQSCWLPEIERLIEQRRRTHLKDYLSEFNSNGFAVIHNAASLGMVILIAVQTDNAVQIGASVNCCFLME